MLSKAYLKHRISHLSDQELEKEMLICVYKAAEKDCGTPRDDLYEMIGIFRKEFHRREEVKRLWQNQ